MVNIVANPGFESGTTTNWFFWASTGGPTGFIGVTTDAYAGSYAGMLTCSTHPGTGSIIILQKLDNKTGFVFDTPFQLRLRYKSLAQCRVTVYAYEKPEGQAGVIKYSASSGWNPATSAWAEIIVDAPAIPGNLNINVVELHCAISGIGELKIDEVSLDFEAPPPTQVDVTYRSIPFISAAVDGQILQPNQTIRWNVGALLTITVPREVVF